MEDKIFKILLAYSAESKDLEQTHKALCNLFGVTFPSKEEVYSNACEYARNVQNPKRNMIIALRQAFKHGANFISKEVNDKQVGNSSFAL